MSWRRLDGRCSSSAVLHCHAHSLGALHIHHSEGGVSAGVIGQMAKLKLQVRQLTLPLLSDVGFDGTDDPREEEEDERRTIWEIEHMARVVDLSILSGEGKRPRSYVHGVEPA
jgi:hypothetical protein